jgi:hypothetical protein
MLEEENDRLEQRLDDCASWPEWASKLLRILQGWGAAEPDEENLIDLPQELADWLAGYRAEIERAALSKGASDVTK